MSNTPNDPPDDDRAVVLGSYKRQFYETVGAAIYVRVHVEQEFPAPSGPVARLARVEDIERWRAELADLARILLDAVPYS